jgi:hypothetical protein
MPEKLFFNPIKQRRETYFIEYRPPKPGASFASLSLVFLKVVDLEKIAGPMETETRNWLARFPVPLMTTAFDDTDSVISLRDGDHLTGWIDPAIDVPKFTWIFEEFSAFTNAHPLTLDLRTIYKDVPFRTEADVQRTVTEHASEQRRRNRSLTIIIVTWFVAIPVMVATVQQFAPTWVGYIVWAYSWWKGYQTWRKLKGYRKLSNSDQQKAERQRKMEHYYYHCERNQAAFSRLRSENFAEDARKGIREEADNIA